jgi:hypothetical protein
MPLTTDPVLQLILADIDERWRIDFLQFVQTGKASQEFLDTLDSDASLQRAVERAIFADESDIREPYQKLMVETQADVPETAQQSYESVLRDARLAAAALEEAKRRAAGMVSDSKVSAALDNAVKASRSAIDALMDSCAGGHPA